jgi:hypothetical protein
MNWLPPQRTNWPPPPPEKKEEGDSGEWSEMGRREGSFRKKRRMANKWDPLEKGMS